MNQNVLPPSTGLLKFISNTICYSRLELNLRFVPSLVAKRVVERDKHVLNEATLDVSFEMCGRGDENSKTIKVTGLPASTTKDSILNYFENERRSGGGEVETVDLNLEAGVAFVTFMDIGGKLIGCEFSLMC